MGVGKTHLVKKFLEGLNKVGKKPVYVSLYGLSTIDEIDQALFQAIYPVLGHKATKVGARLTKTLLGRFGINPNFRLDELLNKFTADLYVFDDLERCEAPINTALGYINDFVEHEGCKVVVIGNETELSSREGYAKRREKLIGKTLEVQSDFEEAFQFFLSTLSYAQARAFLKRNTHGISAIYFQAGLNNFRILQQTMWDFERLFRALINKQRQNTKAMSAVLQLFFALSFELKAGRINASQLFPRTNRLIARMARDDGEAADAVTISNRHYPEIDLNDPILSDAVLEDLLIKGIVDQGAIRASLYESGYFITKAKEAEWRTVWHWFDRTGEEFSAALKEMERKFAARKYSVTGELLHVFGLRLFLSSAGIINKSREDISRECKQYIDDLYAQRRLEIAQPTKFGDDMFFGGYGGLVINEKDTAEYGELFSYLEQKRQLATQDTFPEKALVLLRELESDVQLFVRRICLTNSEENIYFQIPILASIDPVDFVRVILKKHPLDQRRLMIAFQARYEQGKLDRELAPERPWLARVLENVIAKAANESPIEKYRLEKIVIARVTSILNGTRNSAV